MSSGNGCGLCEIQVNNLGVKKGKDTLLRDVSFHLHCGELTAIIGTNGAGKTTLVKSILGEIQHEGTVSFQAHHGEKLNKVTIGYVPQHLEFDKFAPVSVEDFLSVGRTDIPICFKRKKSIGKELDEVLESVGCADLKKRKLGDLSGGELQRVMLANALYPLPELLILDEPVSGVDVKGSENFYEAIFDLKRNFHIAIAMVTHDLNMVKSFADKVILINKTVLKTGTPEEVFGSPQFKDVFLGNVEG